MSRTLISKADLARVLYDWMPDGAYVSTDYSGAARRMSGADLADYLVSRAIEYPDSDVVAMPTVGDAADHEHYWVDAADDETGWHCTICGVTEYPELPPYAEDEYNGRIPW